MDIRYGGQQARYGSGNGRRTVEAGRGRGDYDVLLCHPASGVRVRVA